MFNHKIEVCELTSVSTVTGPAYELRLIMSIEYMSLQRTLESISRGVADALFNEIENAVKEKLINKAYDTLEQPVLGAIKQDTITTLAIAKAANRIADRLGEK